MSSRPHSSPLMPSDRRPVRMLHRRRRARIAPRQCTAASGPAVGTILAPRPSRTRRTDAGAEVLAPVTAQFRSELGRPGIPQPSPASPDSRLCEPAGV